MTAVDVSGTWDVVVETSEGSGTPVLVLQQDGAKVTGKYQGQLGDAPISGTVQGKNIRLTFKTGAGEGVPVEYTGVVDGDAMSGKAKMGAEGEGTFSAKRRSGK